MHPTESPILYQCLSYISVPGFPPAYQACTIASEMGLQFLSNTKPSTVIFASGVNSLPAASRLVSVLFGAPKNNKLNF